MIRKFFGALCVICAALFVLAGDFITALIFAVIAFLILRKVNGTQQTTKSASAISSNRTPAGTYTFQLAGATHSCKFPDSSLSRVTTISHSRVGDICTLKVYEWEGKPAIAVLNPRYKNYDIGVVPANKVNRVLTIIEKYDILVKIAGMEPFEYRGDYYKNCDVTIEYYEKTEQ